MRFLMSRRWSSYWKIIHSSFPTRRMVAGGDPLAEILGHTDPIGARTLIFNRYSLVASNVSAWVTSSSITWNSVKCWSTLSLVCTYRSLPKQIMFCRIDHNSGKVSWKSYCRANSNRIGSTSVICCEKGPNDNWKPFAILSFFQSE